MSQLDDVELEKLIEEAVAPKEGADALTEDTKAAHQRKVKFQVLTKGFYAPDEALAHKTRLEKEKLRVSSGSGRAADGEHSRDDMDASKFQPLVPEQWRTKLGEFKSYHVIKMPRVF